MIEGLGLIVRGLHGAAALIGFGTLFRMDLWHARIGSRWHRGGSSGCE